MFSSNLACCLTNKYIGYCPKSVVPSEEVVDYLKGR